MEGFLDAIDRIHQFGDSFQGEELALDWDEDGVGGEQGIEGEKVEGWGTVDQDEVIVVADFCNAFPEAEFPVVGSDQFQVGADQVLVGGNEMEAVEVSVDDGIADGCIAEDDVVEAGAFRILGDAQAGSGIALGVRVDDEDLKVIGGKGGGQVDGGGRFSHSAFLVGYGENSAQAAMLARKRGPGVRGQGPGAGARGQRAGARGQGPGPGARGPGPGASGLVRRRSRGCSFHVKRLGLFDIQSRFHVKHETPIKSNQIPDDNKRLGNFPEASELEPLR